MHFSVKNGCFGYHKNLILNNISFDIHSGEVLCILGSNGVGKTTLLKCMMGLLAWQTGATYVDDVCATDIPHKKFWQRIAYVPQSKGSAFAFTVFDMVMLGRSAHLGTFEQPSKKDEELSLQAMEEVGIVHLKDKLCTQISGGELQMVLIARALTVNPELLVLDEPESNLDFKNQLMVLEIIQHLANEHGISSIINTHYPQHALKIGTNALILNRDGTSCFGNTCAIVDETNMKKSFNVQVHINEFEFECKRYNNVTPIRVLE